MFQEMLSGDSIMISAKVIACVEEIDCAPVSYFLSINTKENIERRLVEPVQFNYFC